MSCQQVPFVFSFNFVAILMSFVVFAEGPDATNLSESVRRCVFQKPLEVGASVTGQIGDVVPLYSKFTSSFFDASSASYYGSPSYFFVSYYRNLGTLFADPKFKFGDARPENIAEVITNKISHLGSGQIESLLAGSNHSLYLQSSIILGVDLFYWDAIHDQCGYGKKRLNQRLLGPKDLQIRRSDTEYQIRRLIADAAAAGKVLFLGTVPTEDPQKIKINSEATGIRGMWYPQEPLCVESINKVLRENCTLQNRCYLVDLSAVVQQLNRGEKIYVESLARSIDLAEGRPDGVHLSNAGSLYVFEKMKKMFEANPPTCKN